MIMYKSLVTRTRGRISRETFVEEVGVGLSRGEDGVSRVIAVCKVRIYFKDLN